MKASTTVALYGVLLVALFFASHLLAGVLVPSDWVASWSSSGGSSH